jgi:undecaprenyl-diphosphatase
VTQESPQTESKALFRSLRDYVTQIEFAVLLAVFVIAGGAWMFFALANEVTEGETASFDTALLMALRTNPNDLGDPIGPPGFEEMMRDLTALGGVAVLTLLTAGVVSFLLIQGKRHDAILVLVATGGGALLMTVLKDLYGRPRPDLVPHGSYVTSSSFPSGHSMLSAAVYLTLGALIAQSLSQRRLKLFVMGSAILVTVLVGVSRVYLGVHWPTDVLAGWTVGAVWAAACWLVARWLQRHGQMEDDKVETSALPEP